MELDCLAMKTRRTHSEKAGLTLLELLVVLVVIVFLAAMLLPTKRGRKARVPICLSNIKQIEVGFWMFANDNHGEFPMQIPAAAGGTMEFICSEHTFPHFQKLKDYKLQPQLFVCPFETNRQAVFSYEALNDLALSYFLDVDASTNGPSHSILLGDRFMQCDGHPVEPGILAVTTNLNLNWTPDFHARGGSFGFADGHAEFTHDDRLKSIIASQPLATNRFSIP